jgi:hypothetical protein
MLLAVALGLCLPVGQTFAAVGCAQFPLFEDGDFTTYLAALCDGEPSSCTVYDYGLLDRSLSYSYDVLPRECQTGGQGQCDYVYGTGSIRKPQTSNIATTTAAPAQGVQQVVYYQCGNRCYCYTVCAATAPATAPAPKETNANLSRHLSRNVRLKQKRDEAFMPRKNQQAPFAENINFSFPSYFSFNSLRKPGTTIFAKGFVVSTQKLQWKAKTYPGVTAGCGFEVQKKAEEFPLVAAENVKMAPETTSSYIIKVKGVEYLVHTTE